MSNDYILAYGTHAQPQDGRCAMEWVSYLAGEPHCDQPTCVSPVLRAMCIALNDGLDQQPRQRLRPYLTRTIGTAGGRPGHAARLDGDGLARPALHARLAAPGRIWPTLPTPSSPPRRSPAPTASPARWTCWRPPAASRARPARRRSGRRCRPAGRPPSRPAWPGARPRGPAPAPPPGPPPASASATSPGTAPVPRHARRPETRRRSPSVSREPRRVTPARGPLPTRCWSPRSSASPSRPWRCLTGCCPPR